MNVMATSTEPGTVSDAKYQRLVSKYHDLHKLYRDLEQRHAKCDRYMERAYEKYKAAKTIAQEWHAYVDKHRNAYLDHPTPTSSKTTEAKGRSSTDRVTSSQTTEGEQNHSQLPRRDSESESDEIEVVSTRVVKRNRGHSNRAMPPPIKVKQEATSPENPVDLASEDYSSPRLKRQKPIRAETSDLDAFVEHIDTPRKQRHQRATTEEPTKPACLLLTTSSLSEGDVPENVQCSTRTKTESGAGVPHLDPAITARDFAARTTSNGGRNGALHPLNATIPVIPRTKLEHLGRKRKRNHRDHGKFGLLSEDGEEQTSQVKALQHEYTPRADITHRLNSLLEHPSPDQQPLPKRSTPQASSSRRLEPRTAIKEPQTHTANTKAQRQPVVFRQPRGLEESPPPVLPEDEPLRCRPLGSLRLDDFKINPSYLGADYASADTFRGRDQRRCLQGCTRPECCGDAFRKAVEIGAVSSSKTDAEVLEEYLGPSWNLMMGAYPLDKRQDLLVQARAYAYANQHGKHRQAFERRSTPPGFWRTDMPTTQEHEQDRERAHQKERQKVEERWRDAMREGGRWLFRDE